MSASKAVEPYPAGRGLHYPTGQTLNETMENQK